MGLIPVPYFSPMRCVVLVLFLLCARLGAAELRLEVQLRWQGAPVGVPSEALAGGRRADGAFDALCGARLRGRTGAGGRRHGTAGRAR